MQDLFDPGFVGFATWDKSMAWVLEAWSSPVVNDHLANALVEPSLPEVMTFTLALLVLHVKRLEGHCAFCASRSVALTGGRAASTRLSGIADRIVLGIHVLGESPVDFCAFLVLVENSSLLVEMAVDLFLRLNLFGHVGCFVARSSLVMKDHLLVLDALVEWCIPVELSLALALVVFDVIGPEGNGVC